MPVITTQPFTMLRFWSKRRKTAIESSTPTASSPIPSTFPVDQLCCSRESALCPDDIRLVLIDSNRRVVFDSMSIIPVGDRSTEGMHLSACRKFQLLRKAKDTNEIARLIWGDGATIYGADSMKFHQIPDGEKVLVSRVFQLSKFSPRSDSANADSLPSSDSESQYNMNTIRSSDGFPRFSTSSTAPPEQFTRVRNSSLQLDSDDSEEMRTFSPPHRLSKNRRIQMSQKTSLCEPSNQNSPWKSRSRLSSTSSQPEDESGKSAATGILIKDEFRTFIFQHIPIVETEMVRLENRICTAAMHSASFFSNVYKAWQEFCQSLCMLCNAPRIRNPVWLSLAEKDVEESKVAADFCTQLALLVDVYDTKDKKFFLSNMITTVLMYHMSWVASVASPQTAPECHTSPSKGDSPRNLLIGTALNMDSASIPYNPHMAQFLEISGSIGNIHRSTKTIICGGDGDRLALFLQILSYFVRCSTVQHSTKEREKDPLPPPRCFSPADFTPDSLSPNVPYLANLEQPEEDFCPTSLALIKSIENLQQLNSSDFLGRSLLAGPMLTYSPHFVIAGLIRLDANYEKAFESMCDEVRCEASAVHRAAATSLSSSQSSSSVCEVQLPDSLIILADINECSVKVLSSEGIGEVQSPSETVVAMMEQFSELYKAGMAPKFLITFLEDQLFGILGKSLSLVELVSDRDGGRNLLDSPSLFTPDRVRSIIGCDHSDLRLILNVASVYYPSVLNSVLS